MRCVSRGLALVVGLMAVACDGGEAVDRWQKVHDELPGALLSVWGTSSTDVWAVGADTRDGKGPAVLHFDGEGWNRIETGQTQGNLWWVFGFEEGPIYMGGDGGVILRYEDGTFVQMDTPGTDTVFGIWGASADDVWAVGGASESTGGFAWHLAGDAWMPEASLPADVSSGAAIWKVFGTAADDAWFVGSNGVALHWDGSLLAPGDTGVGSSLFTVHASNGHYAAVGGLATGIIVEHDGSEWHDVTPQPPPMGLSGVSLGEGDEGVAVGMLGAVYIRDADGWSPADLGVGVRQNLHGSWIDDQGELWAVGGQTLTPPFTDGVLIHRGEPVSAGGL